MTFPSCKSFFLCVLAAFALFGCKVSQPGGAESKVMKTVKQKLMIGGKNDVNPIQATAQNIAEGQEHFGHHCGICHGLDGEATGVPFANKMAPPIPSFSSKDVQDYTDGQLKWIIENGIDPSGMPAWKGTLTDHEMWTLVNFIRHLPPKGSLGIPDVYKEEHEQHEHMHQHDHADHPDKHSD
jgi:mono/diheme cytochrome c family protein